MDGERLAPRRERQALLFALTNNSGVALLAAKKWANIIGAALLAFHGRRSFNCEQCAAGLDPSSVRRKVAAATTHNLECSRM